MLQKTLDGSLQVETVKVLQDTEYTQLHPLLIIEYLSYVIVLHP